MRFVAAINTRIYGRYYAQGGEIDITGWSRKQMLQFLNLGLMQAGEITAGMITDAIIFEGAGITTTVNTEGQLVVSIDEILHPLDWLEDVDVETKADGQLLGWDEAAQLWKAVTVELDGTTITLASLADVDTTGAEDGWTLALNALTGVWTAVPAASATLAGLDDVDVEGIIDGQTVIWDQSNAEFVPGTPLGAPGPPGPVTWAEPIPWSAGLSGTIGPPATVVTYQGSSYVAIDNSTGVVPTNTTYWRLIVEKGAKGDQGDVGPASTIPGAPGVGVPAGGSAGQALVKLTNADYSTTWGTAGLSAEQVRDTMAAALVAGANVTISVDDDGDTITIASTGGGGGGVDLEAVQDAVDAMIIPGANVTKSYDDAAGTLTLSVGSTGPGGAGNDAMYFVKILTSETVSSIPTVGTLIPGMTLTIPADALSRTAFVSANVAWTGAHTNRCSITVDGVLQTSDITGNLTGGNTTYDVQYAQVPITLGADVPHTVQMWWNASDSTAACVLIHRSMSVHVVLGGGVLTTPLTAEEVQDAAAAMIVAGTGITKVYNDTAGELTISSTSPSVEDVRDIMGATLLAGANVTITVDDDGNAIYIAATGSGSSGGPAEGDYGLWRGPWASLAVHTSFDLTTIPGSWTNVGGWVTTAKPTSTGLANPITGTPPQGSRVVDSSTTTANAEEYLELTIPAGVSAFHCIGTCFTGTNGYTTLIVYKNGANQKSGYFVGWTDFMVPVVPGDVIRMGIGDYAGFNSRGIFGQVEFLKTAAPYMLNHTVVHAGRMWRSQTNNNPHTPGAHGDWVEIPLTSDIADVLGLQAALDTKLDATNGSEFVRDVMATTLVAGTGITVTPNDFADTVTVALTGGVGYSDEQVRDVIGAALVAGTGMAISLDDAADHIILSSTGGGGGGSGYAGYWNGLVTYPAGSLVNSGGDLWTALAENTGVMPVEAPAPTVTGQDGGPGNYGTSDSLGWGIPYQIAHPVRFNAQVTLGGVQLLMQGVAPPTWCQVSVLGAAPSGSSFIPITEINDCAPVSVGSNRWNLIMKTPIVLAAATDYWLWVRGASGPFDSAHQFNGQFSGQSWNYTGTQVQPVGNKDTWFRTEGGTWGQNHHTFMGTLSIAAPVWRKVAVEDIDIDDVDGLQAALDLKAHTVHTHVAASIVDFTEALGDQVDQLIVPGTNLVKVYDDATGKLTISATGSGTGGEAVPGGGTLSVVGNVSTQVGTLRLYNDTGSNRGIIKIRLAAGTAPVGAPIEVNVRKNGTTITPSTLPQLPDGANTALVTIDPPVAWNIGEYLTVDITGTGSTTAGADLTVTVVSS